MNQYHELHWIGETAIAAPVVGPSLLFPKALTKLGHQCVGGLSRARELHQYHPD